MPPDPRPPKERLAIAVHADTFERVHYALVMASAALAIDRPVTLFFTGRAVQALRADGWHRLPGAERDADFRARRVAGFDELLAACGELGARIIACEMALRAEGVAAADLRTDLPILQAGVVTFLGDGGQVVFI
jgi:peroxiredoxin family protein